MVGIVPFSWDYYPCSLSRRRLRSAASSLALRGHSQPLHLPPAAPDRRDVSGKAGEPHAEPGSGSRHASETDKVKASMSIRMETFIANRPYALRWGTQ